MKKTGNNEQIKVNKNSYIKMLNKRIFWDLKIDKLDYKQDKQIIIERIAVHGTENDERIMNKMYRLNTIKKCLMNSYNLNEKVIKYYAFTLKAKEEDFKCFMKTPVQMSC